nr:hypothetical protein [Tanacetum cinerariifolium]
YHKLYDILKQHQNEVNEIRAERLARTANPLGLVAQQQPVYHPQNHPTHHTQNSSTRSQQAATRNKGKAIVNSPLPIYDQEPTIVAEDDEMSKDKEIDKLDNSPMINRGTGYDNQRIGNVVGPRETVEQADWRDDTDDEPEDQKLEAHYMYMAQIQEVNPDAADNSGPYLILSHCKRKQVDQDDDDDDDLANERELLASLIEKLKCEIDDSKNRNKFLETSNKVLVDKLKDLRYFNSLELEVDSLKFQLETQKTQFLNEIDRISREYYYVDHMNAILELSKSKMMSKSFEALQKHAINLELDLQQCQEKIKNDKSFKENHSKEFRKEREQYFEIQDLKAQLQDKGIAINRVMLNNSQGKKQEVEDHRRNVKFSKNRTSVNACNDSLNAKTLNVNFVCVTCRKCVLNDKHDMCVLHYLNGVNSRTTMPMAVPISTREPKRTVN